MIPAHTPPLGPRLLWAGFEGVGRLEGLEALGSTEEHSLSTSCGWDRGKGLEDLGKDSGFGLHHDPRPGLTDCVTWASVLSSLNPHMGITRPRTRGSPPGGCRQLVRRGLFMQWRQEVPPPLLRGGVGCGGQMMSPGEQLLRLSAPSSERSTTPRGFSVLPLPCS